MSCGLIGILSGAICARRVGNPLTTSCFTVMLHWIYEAFFFIYILFGVEWVMPRRVLDLFSSWGNSLGRGQVKQI